MTTENKELNIILMGPPAAGKGTQSELIVSNFAVPHISTGDMLRSAVSDKTPLGLKAAEYMNAGKLVPDDVIIGLVEERISKDDCRKGFLLDGFPRTIPQAEALDTMLAKLGRKINSVILLTADDEVLTGRITSRRVCPNCGASYNVNTKKPKVEGVCDSCGATLIQRKDDNAEAFKVRLKAYADQTFSIADYYAKKGVVSEVNALQSIDEVFADVKKALSEAE